MRFFFRQVERGGEQFFDRLGVGVETLDLGRVDGRNGGGTGGVLCGRTGFGVGRGLRRRGLVGGGGLGGVGFGRGVAEGDGVGVSSSSLSWVAAFLW